MNKYSVLILYPEYVADSYGAAYYAHVEAESPDDAIKSAIAECMRQQFVNIKRQGRLADSRRRAARAALRCVMARVKAENAPQVAPASCPHPVQPMTECDVCAQTGAGVWTVADSRTGLGGGRVVYRATDDALSSYWFPSIHMPREHSRITLEVVSVRIQHLQDISESDARAEGVCFDSGWESEDGSNGSGWLDYLSNDESFAFQTPTRSYQSLWASIYGAESWESNPLVWVCEFKKAEPA